MTNIELAKRIIDNIIRVNTCYTVPEILKRIREGYYDLGSMFSWARSPEGYDFWARLAVNDTLKLYSGFYFRKFLEKYYFNLNSNFIDIKEYL